MIQSRVNISSLGFAKVTEAIERKARQGVTAAAEEAATVAQATASIDLELELMPAHGTEEGYAAGIKSRKHSRWSTAPLAVFFDKGTLGERKTKLAARTRRKETWQVKRGSGSYTAQRHQIDPEMGIPGEHFFGKARRAGRKRLLETLRRGI